MELAPLELALGHVLGSDGPVALPVDDRPEPLAALEAAVLGALRRPPCLVSFSGGRDSSVVLAVATRVARREGLPDPVPATIRAPAAPAAQESGWQELVVDHLGLDDWVRLELTDELDLVGPIAQRVLRRHGLLWPFNAHFHLPLLEAARGGSLLTGIGGDELFRAATSRRAAAVLTGRVQPRPRDVRRIALHAAPHPLRRWWHGREDMTAYPWLTSTGRTAGRSALAAWRAAEPRPLLARLRHVRGARYLRVGVASLDRLAGDAGTVLAHPLLDLGLWAAVGRRAPGSGHLGRTDAMRALFGAMLPGALLARPGKATFDEVFFNRHSRALAARWDGEGAPTSLVDAAELRRHWAVPAPRAQSFSLLQAAWLASAGDGGEQAIAGGGDRLPAAGTPQA